MKKLLILGSLFLFLGANTFAQAKKHKSKHKKHMRHHHGIHKTKDKTKTM